MSDENKKDEPKVQADNNSIAVGNISAGGNIGDININTGYTVGQVSVLITQIESTFQPKPFDGRCPYKGLDVFEEEDAELFFGREKLVGDLVSRVKESRTVFVTGPSGSGKSSLVRAGLIHALKQGSIKSSDRWLYATMKPGRDPLESLANAFSRLKSPELGSYFRQHVDQVNVLHECAESALTDNKNQRLVLFIDQFEEVFTQISKEEERVAFLNLLTHAATIESGRVIILFSMRSDFVSNCATYPQLNALLNQKFVQIGAMQPEELVSAIAQPALRAGLRIDPDLIAQIINEMKGEPGALPLMQFALKDLFDSQQEKSGVIALTLNDYLQRGGIHKALERHADDSFSKLSKNEQELARSIFSGLIEIGRGTQDTRRTALFDELVPANTKAEDVEAIVQKLADARLITTDEAAGKDTVMISHEKLIDAWPWLKKLVNENRDVIALQNEITDDAKEWDEHKHDQSYLYTGIRLASVHEQLQAKRLVLSGSTLDFIKAGNAQQKRSQIFRLMSVIVLILVGLVFAILVSPKVLELIAKSRAHGEMVYIPEGPSIVGTENSTFVNEFGFPPRQNESLPAFQIGKYEVSNYQYQLCIKYGDCIVPFGGQSDFYDITKKNYPVVNITIFHANRYCQWLGQRLPTQLEWERAARGPNGKQWPWGDSDPTPETANMLWKDYSPTGLQPVDSNPAGKSPEDIYNLIGNVTEFTSSFSRMGETYDPTQFWDGNPETFDGTLVYVQSGGSWKRNMDEVAIFDSQQGIWVSDDLGFRCASDVK